MNFKKDNGTKETILFNLISVGQIPFGGKV